MTTTAQNSIREKYYTEAIRYMDNAKGTLIKANKHDNYYQDDKYVKFACGIAYSGVLIALDGYFLIKDVKAPRGRKSVEFYQESVSKLDKKMLNYFSNVYKVLHLAGYYDGVTNVKVIQAGFEEAYNIIKKIKPTDSLSGAKNKNEKK